MHEQNELEEFQDIEDVGEPVLEEELPLLHPLPQDLNAPQLTVRAVLTGMCIGGLLSLCNIYAGLKVGWGFNMSIIAVLSSFAIWQPLSRRFGVGEWGMLENNTCQTTASGAASISSAGLVSAIPALTILTGFQPGWGQLAIWTLSVCLVGVFVGAALRRQFLVVDPLPFPAGVATAVTLKDLYASGAASRQRVWMLLSSSLLAGGWLLVHTFMLPIKKLYLSITLPFLGRLKDVGVMRLNTAHLGWGIEPSLLLIGTGILVGRHIAASMFAGAVVAWGVLGPLALVKGWAIPGAHGTGHGAAWYSVLVKWLMWPGVAIMVTSSLTSLFFSVRSMWKNWSSSQPSSDGLMLYKEDPSTLVPKKMFLVGMGGALLLSVVCQYVLFSIPVWMGTMSVLLTFLLAVVAARVSGVTGITPKGALGKVSQLSAGLFSPGQVTPNLMAANVTAGASAQSADILHDLKTGYLLGASPRAQLVGQLFGIISGAFVGSYAYLLLIPDPKKMLLTSEWPAPAVAVWKSVAELFKDGFHSLPTSALVAGVIGAFVGIFLAVGQKTLSPEKRHWLPGPAAFGLAFVLPATASATIFLGGMLLSLSSRVASSWTERFALTISAGLIMGESLFGVLTSILTSLLR